MLNSNAQFCKGDRVLRVIGTYRNALLDRKNSAAVVAPDSPVLHRMKHRVQVVYKNVAEVIVGIALSQKMNIFGACY